ncbi:hypothetical protein WHR41_06308 [Cladosporium halotolerans]|uniref:F-box domain-containing protein n=1 Tax=Cladosporium halotolerans TaxID=1052096 RepID=A0AB34KH01_9PEZI
MSTTILDLPSELIASIFHFLNDGDIFAARSANRVLERASFSFFAKRFFRKKGYMITTPSLQVLQSVAAHEELRPYVQHVWFNPDCFTFGSLNPITPTDHACPSAGTESGIDGRLPDFTQSEQSRYEAYSECIEDYHQLIFSETKLAEMLTAAFATLPNLKAVGMRRSDQHSPWGWQRLKDAIGQDPRELGEIPEGQSFLLSGPTQLYIPLMKALAASGAIIQRLYTDAIEIDDISPEALPQEALAEASCSVLYLEINATKGNLIKLDLPGAGNAQSTSVQNPSGLSKLLSATPNLRELGLMIFPDRKQSHLIPPQPYRPESWRTSYPYKALERLSASIKLQNLRRIKLEKFTVSPSILISLLQPSAQHLTSIKLRDIRLLPDLQDSATSTFNPNADRTWEPIFNFLATFCPKLSYLLLYHLSHPSGGIRFVANASHTQPEDQIVTHLEGAGEFMDYENISVEAGIPHSDPDLQGPEKREEIMRARRVVGDRVRALVEGHWYGRNTYSYEMDDLLWHTDTSDEEW